MLTSLLCFSQQHLSHVLGLTHHVRAGAMREDGVCLPVVFSYQLACLPAPVGGHNFSLAKC